MYADSMFDSLTWDKNNTRNNQSGAEYSAAFRVLKKSVNNERLNLRSLQDFLHSSELFRYLKMLEFLSEYRWSRTRVDKCQLVSPT